MNRRDFFKLAGMGLLGLVAPKLGNERFGIDMAAGNKLGDMLLEMKDPNIAPPRQAEIVRLLNEVGDREDKYKAWLDGKGNVNWKYLNLPFHPIYSEVLATAKSSITIPIPPGYKHLLLIGSGRSTSANVFGEGLMGRFNDDSGANYNFQSIDGVGASAGAGAASGSTFAYIGALMGGGAPAGRVTSFYTFIPHYLGSFHKVVLSSWLGHDSGANFQTTFMASNWASTSLINSLTMIPSAASMAAGCAISIYVIF